MTEAHTITVHMIGQAHLDPVWLWSWQAGLDEALATCRTACDLLDHESEFIFTRGEAWVYQQIAEIDPELFSRIKHHVAAGRWEIAGGWWLQPDCNLPSGNGLEQQIATGKRFLLKEFGQFPDYGYNVDSFGHAATLPGLMRAAGQSQYVMMRPQESECALPARLFRWRGFVDGPEVTTFRIAGSYGSGPDEVREAHIRNACSALPEGVTDTMCFYGVGDHGGGPTAAIITWIQNHRDAFPGCRLVFSSPSRFFAAIAKNTARLPLVTGELQYHAIGCYSVMRAIKTGVRRAEHLLKQAQIMTGVEPGADSVVGGRLEEAWRQVAFVHFHDIFGGTCIPSAYPQIYARLGTAQQTADDLLQKEFRRKLSRLPDDPLQRIVIGNASDAQFAGFVEVEPWTQWTRWPAQGNLLDANNLPVPFQVLPAESAFGAVPRLLFRVRLTPGEMQEFKIAQTGHVPAALAPMELRHNEIRSGTCAALKLGAEGGLRFGNGPARALPTLALLDDRSDNWSHGIDRYPEGPVTSAVWNDACVMVQGPLVSSLLQTGRIGNSTLRAQWRIFAGEPFVELKLTVHWMEALKLLKWVWPLDEMPSHRRDGICGGSLLRENDGKESPWRDWTLLEQAGTTAVGVVCPDVFALDAAPGRLRFTLLRAPIMTHHEPNTGTALQSVHSDQGVHEFRFRFYGGEDITADRLERDALMLQRPPVTADLTRGMPRRTGM